MFYLSHCNINSGSYGLALYNGDVLRNSELAFDSHGLLSLGGNDIKVINNNLHDSGYMPDWIAMVQCGNYCRELFSHNTMYNSGRAIMGVPGRASIIEYNNMYNAMRLTSDGGIFYTFMEAGNAIL